jgi:peptidoglycan/xylan/chitin deacetylase (PgdA/CDA1 family)
VGVLAGHGTSERANLARMMSSIARKAVKVAALPLGPFRWRPGDLGILLYHRVGDGPGEIELPVERFERHLEALVQAGGVRSLDDALADGRGGIVVTFDDGSRDFHERVVPLLARYEVPAVLYLATGLVRDEKRGERGDVDGLTWSQLAEAVATGFVTVGAHTHSHRTLSRATEQVAEDEMRRSKDLIEDRLGVACRHFAYPFAVGSPEADRVARRLFGSAALDAWKTNRRDRMDLHRLGRMPVLASDGQLFFRAKVRGMLERESLAYRALGRGPWKAA